MSGVRTTDRDSGRSVTGSRAWCASRLPCHRPLVAFVSRAAACVADQQSQFGNAPAPGLGDGPRYDRTCASCAAARISRRRTDCPSRPLSGTRTPDGRSHRPCPIRGSAPNSQVLVGGGFTPCDEGSGRSHWRCCSTRGAGPWTRAPTTHPPPNCSPTCSPSRCHRPGGLPVVVGEPIRFGAVGRKADHEGYLSPEITLVGTFWLQRDRLGESSWP
jgi:hypothetical protein